MLGKESVKHSPGMNDVILVTFEVTGGKNVRCPATVESTTYGNEKAVFCLMPYCFTNFFMATTEPCSGCSS